MVEADEDEGQPNGAVSNKSSKPKQLEPQFGRIGDIFRGLAKMTREFEQCPRGSKVTERLIFGGMACLVLVTYIRYGH